MRRIMAEKKNAEAKAPVNKKVLYFGPTIPGVAIENTIYSEMPPDATEAFTECPELRQLFIPEDQMVKLYPIAENSLVSRKGAAFAAYQAALAFKASRRR
jgi:hypothetical protein